MLDSEKNLTPNEEAEAISNSAETELQVEVEVDGEEEMIATASEEEVENLSTQENIAQQQMLEKLDRLLNQEATIKSLFSRIKALEEDLDYNALKPLLLAISRTREDFKRILRAFEKPHNEKDRHKDMKGILLTMKQILKLNGMVLNGEEWLYGNESIENDFKANVLKTFIDEQPTEISSEYKKTETIEEKIDELICLVEESCEVLQQRNQVLLSVIKEDKKRKILRECLKLYNETKFYWESITELSETDYTQQLKQLVERFAEMLTDFGVQISALESELFNPDYQIALNVVETSKKDDDGKIAERLNDRYMYGDHVVAEEIVSIYAYKECTSEEGLEEIEDSEGEK